MASKYLVSPHNRLSPAPPSFLRHIFAKCMHSQITSDKRYKVQQALEAAGLLVCVLLHASTIQCFVEHSLGLTRPMRVLWHPTEHRLCAPSHENHSTAQVMPLSLSSSLHHSCVHTLIRTYSQATPPRHGLNCVPTAATVAFVTQTRVCERVENLIHPPINQANQSKTSQLGQWDVLWSKG